MNNQTKSLENKVNESGFDILASASMGLGCIMIAYGGFTELLTNMESNAKFYGLVPVGLTLAYRLGKHVGNKMYGEK